MEPLFDSEESRLRHIRAAQTHCDHYLSPLAEVKGKSVLVIGAGAGTEILWCLRHGAREVVGIDPLPQPPGALERALAEAGLPRSFATVETGVEEAAARLDRRFEVVLANNVYEHVGDLAAAFAALRGLLVEGGRAAVFSSPLYHSARGSHLPTEPWEHLWSDGESLRARLLPALPVSHPLRAMPLADYLESEITLNRARPADFLACAASSGLALLNARWISDEALAELPRYRERIAGRHPDLTLLDLSAAGVALELVRLDGPAKGAGSLAPTEPRVLERRRQELESAWRADVEVLHAVERSWSFRLGRLLTAPGRWLRGGRG